MGFFWGSPAATAEELQSIRRRCNVISQAYRNCVAANGQQAPKACEALEIKAIDCKAQVCCPEQAAEHSRCYHSLVEKGKYEGKRDCNLSIEAMRKCLKARRVDPVA